MCGCSTPSTAASATPIAGVTFKVDDMSCGHCVGVIRTALEAGMPGTAISIDLAGHRVTVAGDGARAEGIIRDVGYDPQVVR